MKLGMETISSSMLGHLAVVMFTRTPVSKTEKGRVISTLSTTTFEIRVPNPGCFAMDFPLDESKAYISHLYVESTEDLEVPLLLEPPSCIMNVNMWHHFHSTKECKKVDHLHVLVQKCRNMAMCQQYQHCSMFIQNHAFLSQLPTSRLQPSKNSQWNGLIFLGGSTQKQMHR